MINISFDFDPVSYSVSNILVTEKGTSGLDKIVEQMKEVIPLPAKSTTKTTGRKKKEKNEDIIKLEDNKLVLTQKLIDLLEAEPGDRLCIRFKDFNGEYFPIIAKSEVFADPEAGNKLTKSLTVSYRGKQREELVIYGEEFTFEETFEGSGICKLIGQNTITADDKVFKGNKDLDSYDDEDKEKKKSNKSQKKEDVVGLNPDTKFSYTPVLPNSKSRVDSSVNILDFDFNKKSDSNIDNLLREIEGVEDL